MVRLVDPSVRCIDVRSANPAPKYVDPFYQSAEWTAFQSAVVAERGRVCEDPACDGRTHRPGMRVFADHIVERKDGGAPFDRRNIMLRCGASHSRKTALARAKRTTQRF